jgi:DNA replication and repair protein RecF
MDRIEVQHTVQMKIPRSGRRTVHKDGQYVPSLASRGLCGAMVVFSSRDHRIVSGEPAMRRSYLDNEIPLLSGPYGTAQESYRKTVEQKNKLLKDDRIPPAAKRDSLGVWNQQLVEYGARLVVGRLRFIAQVRPLVIGYYQELAGEEAKIGIRYVSKIPYTEDIAEPKAAQILREELEANLEREIVIGQAIRGPHRDDVMLSIYGKEARDYASEGQVRGLAICLKLAVRDLVSSQMEEDPVLLVDDIGGELDPERRERAVRLLGARGQVVMATQDPEAYQAGLADWVGETQVWGINSGAVVDV